MIKILTVLGVIILTLAVFSVTAKEQTLYDMAVEQYGQAARDASLFVVGMKDGKAVKDNVSLKVIPEINAYLVPSYDLDRIRVSDVAYVEPDVPVKIIDTIPDDTLWSQQWGPAKIDGPAAWDTTTGDSSVLIAVIDTGIDYNHPDIAANYQPGGFDFYNNDSDPMDGHSHGTHVAGTIAAVTNNDLGVAGMCCDCRVMAEKVLSDFGSGSSFDVANGMIHATDFGADILNLSLGGGFNQVGEDATNYAYDAGVLVVSACGNSSNSNCIFPAGNVNSMAISCSTSTDEMCGFSSHGSRVDVSAPGTNILSTILNNVYGTKSGTSMSSPHAAGTAALALSANLALTNEQLWGLLQLTAIQPLSETWNPEHGFGTINAGAAIASAFDPPAERLPRPAEPTPTPSNTPGPTLTPTITNTPDPNVTPSPTPCGSTRLGCTPTPTPQGTPTPTVPGPTPTVTNTPTETPVLPTPTSVPSSCEVLVRIDGAEVWLPKPLAFCQED